MALSSFFKRKKTEGKARAVSLEVSKPARRGTARRAPLSAGTGRDGARESPAVTQARTWALRRLMGAAVLLLLGLVLFPLIFETKPRPLPMDLHITVAPGTVAPVAGGPPAPARPVPPMIIETAEPEPTAAAAAPASAAPLPAAPPRQVASTVPAVALAPAPVPAAKAAPTPTPESKVSAPVIAASSPAAYPTAARFVVQVGTFSDDATVRQARLKVEKLGLKTYTQGLSTDAGRRVRVRVGPFATRDEAAQVLNKLKGAGLPGAVLAL